MAPPKKSTTEQLAFLMKEDLKWQGVKEGDGTLKNFYIRTAQAYLEKWPVTLDDEALAAAEGDEAKAKAAAEVLVHTVSARVLLHCQFLTVTLQYVHNWFTHRHRKARSTPSVPEPLLDLSGKYSRKRIPMQQWQAFSVLYYRPKNSTLRPEVISLFNRRNDPTAVRYLKDFFPPDADVATMDYLAFLSAFLRERCTRLTREEEDEVRTHIETQHSIAVEHQDQPWFLDEDFEKNPILAENKYTQEYVSPCDHCYAGSLMWFQAYQRTSPCGPACS